MIQQNEFGIHSKKKKKSVSIFGDEIVEVGLYFIPISIASLVTLWFLSLASCSIESSKVASWINRSGFWQSLANRLQGLVSPEYLEEKKKIKICKSFFWFQFYTMCCPLKVMEMAKASGQWTTGIVRIFSSWPVQNKELKDELICGSCDTNHWLSKKK